MKKKTPQKFWISLAAIWLALILVMPQISVEVFGVKAARLHALHPFFNWHLFTDVGGGVHRFNVDVQNCKIQNAEAANGISFIFPGASRYRTYHRLAYVGNLLENGDKELARETLRKVLDQNFLRYRGCEAVLYWYTTHQPNARNFVEESRSEI